MSAPVAADVLRELGAEPRRFRSVASAVKFYDAYVGRTAHITQDLSRFVTAGMPVSAAQREQDRVTHDKLMLVFRAIDPQVDAENLHGGLRRVMDWLAGNASHAYLATQHGMDERAFSRYVAFYEDTLRNRMKARGLFHVVEYCPCGCGVEQVDA